MWVSQAPPERFQLELCSEKSCAKPRSLGRSTWRRSSARGTGEYPKTEVGGTPYRRFRILSGYPFRGSVRDWARSQGRAWRERIPGQKGIRPRTDSNAAFPQKPARRPSQVAAVDERGAVAAEGEEGTPGWRNTPLTMGPAGDCGIAGRRPTEVSVVSLGHSRSPNESKDRNQARKVERRDKSETGDRAGFETPSEAKLERIA